MKEIIETKKILINEQYGKPHSLTQVSSIVNTAKINFNIDHMSSKVALDLEKAFDVVWHDGLINKLLKG